MRMLILLLVVIPFSFSYSQPKLVTTLSYQGQKQGGALYRANLPATTPGIIYSFDNTAPHYPGSGLTAGADDWLYGMTDLGGANGRGVFYRIKRDGSLFAPLYHTSSLGTYSQVPYLHTDGQVYFADGQEIKKYDPIGSVVNSIIAPNFISSKEFIIDDDDWIYFLNNFGNSRLYRIKTDGSLWTELRYFDLATDGGYGRSITEVPGDSLFGIHLVGGSNDGGTIYSIHKDGTGFKVHHHFTAASGTYPESKLVYFDGKLFGTTTYGGDDNLGVIFSINADGSNYRVIYHFELSTSFNPGPGGSIAISSNGRIFGAYSDLYQSSSFQNFRLYKIDTSGENLEPFFTGDPFNAQRENGYRNGDILLLDDELIFFPTFEYGHHNGGVLNNADTLGNGSGLYHYGYSPTGFNPSEGVVKATNGKLYGTTAIGGISGGGVIYSTNYDGTGYAKIHEFTDMHGYEPTGTLLEASDGKLYGAIRFGGPNFSGSLYRIDKTGLNFEIIKSFDGIDGSAPTGSLVEGSDGKLYGGSFWGGGYGTIFSLNKNGTAFTTLKAFVSSEIYYPYNGLRLSKNYLYGTCGYGGAANKGGVFRIKTDGTGFQILHEFSGVSDGELPVATPVVASNGKLYGTAAYGGTMNYGTIYRLDSTGGNFSVLHQFSDTDGAFPWSGLMQASDGNIYGSTSTSSDPSGVGGALFRISTDGTGFNVVKYFNTETEGSNPSRIIDLNFAVLPLQWLQFDATKQSETVILTWKTSQEVNTDRFDVQRSADGVAFEKIGEVAAAGFSSIINSYSFRDERPLRGINYYRILQKDHDGRSSYSRSISVNMGLSNAIVIAPNPARDHLSIRLPGGGEFEKLIIVDANGKTVYEQRVSATSFTVDVRALAQGWHVLSLSGKNSYRFPFLKQ